LFYHSFSDSEVCHFFSGYLPKTAYIKMIDIWLIFAMSIPFCEVLLCTFIDNFREEGMDTIILGQFVFSVYKKTICTIFRFNKKFAH
jgi:hypothetical protein